MSFTNVNLIVESDQVRCLGRSGIRPHGRGKKQSRAQYSKPRSGSGALVALFNRRSPIPVFNPVQADECHTMARTKNSVEPSSKGRVMIVEI
jgi:hypothetical protein